MEERKNQRKLTKLRNMFLKTEKELNFSLTELIEEFRRVKNSVGIAEEKLIKIGVKRLNQIKMQIEENEERLEMERIKIERVFGNAEEIEEMREEQQEEQIWDSASEEDYHDEVDNDDELEQFQNQAFSKKLVTRKRKKVVHRSVKRTRNQY